jgi:hypothetical protein
VAAPNWPGNLFWKNVMAMPLMMATMIALRSCSG